MIAATEAPIDEALRICDEAEQARMSTNSDARAFLVRMIRFYRSRRDWKGVLEVVEMAGLNGHITAYEQAALSDWASRMGARA